LAPRVSVPSGEVQEEPLSATEKSESQNGTDRNRCEEHNVSRACSLDVAACSSKKITRREPRSFADVSEDVDCHDPEPEHE